MDRPRDCHTKWSKTKTNIIWYHLYVESKKKKKIKQTYKIETDSQTSKTNIVTKGERRQGGEE